VVWCIPFFFFLIYFSADALNCLLQRDLRRLEYKLDDPIVLIRRHAVVLSIGGFRSVVMFDRVLLLLPDTTEESMVSRLASLLSGMLSKMLFLLKPECDLKVSTSSRDSLKESEPVQLKKSAQHERFEYSVYEALMYLTTIQNVKEFEGIEHQTQSLLKVCRENSILPFSFQEKFRSAKNKVSKLLLRTEGLQRLMADLLDNDEDLTLLNLTTLQQNPSLYLTPLNPDFVKQHQSMEILFETYMLDVHSLESRINFLSSQIHNTGL
jgi:hypothetical protein